MTSTVVFVLAYAAAVTGIRTTRSISHAVSPVPDVPVRQGEISWLRVDKTFIKPAYFLEGLAVDPQTGDLYSSSGIKGKSALHRYRLVENSSSLDSTAAGAGATEVGAVAAEILRAELPDARFGEGVTVTDDGALHQLDYTNGRVYHYTTKDLQLVEQTKYLPNAEGWGLASHAGTFFSSDGTSRIYKWHLNSSSVEELGVHTPSGHRVSLLNELEWVEGELWANYYGTRCIARIEPDSGEVKGWVVAPHGSLFTPAHPAVSVMNGIAYNPDNKHLYLSGKMWPRLFQVSVAERTEEEQEHKDAVWGSLSQLCPYPSMSAADASYWAELSASS